MMKRFILFFCFLIVSYSAWSETAYLTLVNRDSTKTFSKTDISIHVGDKEIPLSEFFAVDVANRDPDLLNHPAARRQYIVVIDLLYLNPSQVLEVRKLVQQFVSQVPPDDLIALAAITNQDGLRFFSGLTADRSKLIAGWNAMGKVVLSGMVEGPEGNLYPSNFSAETAPLQLLPDQEFLANLKTYQTDPKVKEQLAPVYIQALVDLSSLFSTIQGRKHLIFFTPGTDVKGLSVDLTEMAKQRQKDDEQKKKDEIAESEEHKNLTELTRPGPRDIEKIAQAGPGTKKSRESDAGVVSRLVEGSDGHIHVFNPSTEDNGFIKDLTEKTQGSYHKLQDFSSAVTQILDSDKTFYVLGWKAEHEKNFHELHPINIKAGASKIEAPTRWLALKPVTEYTPLEMKAHLAQALYKRFGEEDSYRFWSDIILDDGVNRVSSFTEIPGQHLLNTKSRQLKLQFYGYAMEQDQIVDFYSTPISMDLTNPKLKERLQKAGLKVWNVLFAGHGPVTVRTIVLNTETGQTISHTGVVHYKDTDFLLSNPFFPSSNFDWVFWPKPDQTLARRGKQVKYPYTVGADIFAPELNPRVQSAEKGKVIYFKMYNFTQGNNRPSVHLRFLGENGTSFEIEKFGLMQQPRTVQRGGMEAFWTIESLPNLTKGSYRLQVDVIDHGKNKEVIRDVPTTVP
jgi:hypothetical protein